MHLAAAHPCPSLAHGLSLGRLRPCLAHATLAPSLPPIQSEQATRARDKPQSPTEIAQFYYERVWSEGRIRELDHMMAEQHEQLDQVWQPQRQGGGGGRRGMKRGILAFRAAYPDLCFRVLLVAAALPEHTSTNTSASSSTQALSGNMQQPTCAATSISSTQEPGTTAASTTPTGALGAGQILPPPVAGDMQGQGWHADALQPALQGPSGVGGTACQPCSVVVHWAAEGTNLGPIRGTPPTGKRISFSGMTRIDFDHQGQMCRSHVYRQASEDEAAHFMSTGLLPWTPQPGDKPAA